MHHGGALLYSSFTRYAGGSINYFDFVSRRFASIGMLRNYVEESRPLCDKNITKFYYKIDRAKAASVEIRQDDAGDECDKDIGLNMLGTPNVGSIYMIGNNREDRQDGVDNEGSDDSDYGSVELVYEDYILEEDGVMFEMNMDKGVEDDGTTFNHVSLFSTGVHEQLHKANGEVDCVGSNNEGMNSNGDSNDEVHKDGARLDQFPRYNAKADSRNP
ncbi:hypothetical protein LIER_43591 [Lithospermum erythrorhizon]|uniref:Uncharacterized protein n=1 Tax=Lithospermum erythrorhizon TaxID=34254 RepID=A0AAV3QDE0_LITER